MGSRGLVLEVKRTGSPTLCGPTMVSLLADVPARSRQGRDCGPACLDSHVSFWIYHHVVVSTESEAQPFVAKPSGVHLDRVIVDLGLPKQMDHQGVIGVKYDYHLARDQARLSHAKSLSEQGVRAGEVLWLEVDVKPFAAGEAIAGELGQATYRDEQSRAARRALMVAVNEVGFGVQARRLRKRLRDQKS